jgi:hypothetical protein
VIEQEILPRLDQEVPDQPSAPLLEASPLHHRFTLVFDREGYSPAFFARMKRQRVACLTYHKYPGEAWTAWWTIVPRRFLSPYQWPTRITANSMAKCARPRVNSIAA